MLLVFAGSKQSRSCRVSCKRTADYLRRSVASWQAMFGEEVPPFEASYTSCKDLARLVKEFLGRSVSHSRSAQLSFQSIKKGLPSSCSCMTNGMIDKLVSSLSSSPRQLPDGYLDFVRKEVSGLFKKGWDSAYESFCLTTSPPLSSVCVPESSCKSSGSRSTGGCLGWNPSDQASFLDVVLRGEGSFGEPVGKLLVVQSAGKPRALSKFNAECLHARPLHKTIYGHLKKFKWLLVGPPTREKLQDAGFKEGGGSLVSGDYAAATDGLSIEVAEVILESLLENALFVPEVIKEGALSLLRPTFYHGDLFSFDNSFEPSVGQMMGSYLSFPLLCLQNYLAFRWSLRGTKRVRVPVLINGDDILFQKDNHFSKWESSISSVGFTVERTKTDVSDTFGTINSTLLQWVDGSLEPCWSARFGMFRAAEHPGSLGRSFSEFLRGCHEPELRFRCGREFFKWHLSELRSCGVSLPSLGFRGLLARRLAKVFGLLELPSAEFPAAFQRHDVTYDSDFITDRDIDSLSPQELFESSLELGSMKWSRGWRPVDVTRSAILHCLDLTAAKGNRFDYPVIEPWVWSSDHSFRFSLRQRLLGRRVTTPSSEFLRPFPPRGTILFSWIVFSSILEDQIFGPPPSYEEACCGAVW
ncbi:MAG: RNA-dependent RNA polymerase [Pestalotiopsis botourmiavirus 2]|uniref:RNA-dependent RNA polymerase n=1 Tax=Pestalotiopsis botourmiavirus 2 TaxID=2816839 RepID=A0A8A6C6Q1_9VIRU|nr:MAG: RNA-dependent RNA polymerase [Pestalotiopsis botourmiavirus 2]QTH80196.1 MAG: RNA-dependent RNA polymerase [Pestalotiopsis botourmiavirus 2]